MRKDKFNNDPTAEIRKTYLQRFYENADQGLFQTRPDGRWLRVNPALARLYGYETPEALRQACSHRHQLDVDPKRREAFLTSILQHGKVSGFEVPVYHRDGRVLRTSETAWAVRDRAGRLVCYEGVVSDITPSGQEEETSREAHYDSLTRLPNRKQFLENLEETLTWAERQNRCVAVLFVDLDHFKHINDTLGHAAGDRLLQKLVDILKSCLRPDDKLARLGGDEFVALLPGVTSEEAMETAQRWLDILAHPIPLVPGQELFATVSIGVSLFPDHGRDRTVLLRHADIAMYRAKQQGRNRCQLFSEALNIREYERMILSVNLRKAIEQEHLALVYQPKVSLTSGLMTGVEALVRWKHRIHGTVSPDRFIEIAEETGLVVPLGEWVLREACRQAVAWKHEGLPLEVSVNVSARQFQSHELVNTVRSLLNETEIEAGQLILELTESILINNLADSVAILQHLKDLGVRLSVDDFGTGYSSLSYLRRFPLDELKIDRSFVKRMLDDPKDRAILQAIIALAHALGLTVTAEGVENRAQRSYLCLHDCDTMQGYWFSPPVTAEEIPALYERTRRDSLQIARSGLSLVA